MSPMTSPSLAGYEVATLGKRILLYSASADSLANYADTFVRIGVDVDTVGNLPDAKKKLQSGDYDALLADVTNFESSGQKLIHWAQNHMSAFDNFKTHGFTRTDIPAIPKSIYSRGSDQRFYFDHQDIDQLAALLSSIFISKNDIAWINDLRVGQRKLRQSIGEGTATGNPVFLNGASGLGAESLAQLVHCSCDRRPNEFVVLDCNPRQSFDYTYKTDIDNNQNRAVLKANFELLLGKAYKGTLFLRSFTHLSLMAQSALVDVLKKGLCILPGTTQHVKFEGRIIFCSSQNISELVQHRDVDERLYAMLAKNTMAIKPLAQYPDDLVPLAEAIVEYLCVKARGRVLSFTESAKRLIRNYPWAGNLVQLYEVIRMATVTAKKMKIRTTDLPIQRIEPLDEQAELLRLMETTDNNVSKVADELGRSRPYVYKKLREYRIEIQRPEKKKKDMAKAVADE